VLLPVAHATTLAGAVTLIGTSSNLLIAGIAADEGVHVSMLSFAPVALPVCLVGWVLLLPAAPRLLRGETGGESHPQPWRVEIPIAAGAIAIGRRAADIASSASRSTCSRRSRGTASRCRGLRGGRPDGVRGERRRPAASILTPIALESPPSWGSTR
jgi:di/tricarboxylate transporter